MMANRWVQFLVMVPFLIASSCGIVSAQSEANAGVARFAVRNGLAALAQESPYDKIVRDSIDVILRENNFVPATDPTGSGELYIWEYTILTLVPRLHLSVTVFDNDRNVLVSSTTGRARANLTLYNSVDELIFNALEDVSVYRELARVRPASIGPVPIAAIISIPSPEDEIDTVILQPDAPLGLAGETIILAEDTEVFGRVVRPKAYSRDFFLTPSVIGEPDGEAAQSRREVRRQERQDESTTTVAADGGSLPRPVPHRRLGVQAHYSYARILGAGFGVRYSVIPDRLYVAQEFYVHVTPPAVSDAVVPIHVEGRLMVGTLLFGSQSGRFGVELSSGIGGTLTTYSSGVIPPYYDWYWNFANFGTILRTGRQRWFARIGANYGFETDRGFFVDGLNEDNFNPQLYVGTIRSW